jgi:hypothetical protein
VVTTPAALALDEISKYNNNHPALLNQNAVRLPACIAETTARLLHRPRPRKSNVRLPECQGSCCWEAASRLAHRQTPKAAPSPRVPVVAEQIAAISGSVLKDPEKVRSASCFSSSSLFHSCSGLRLRHRRTTSATLRFCSTGSLCCCV